LFNSLCIIQKNLITVEVNFVNEIKGKENV